MSQWWRAVAYTTFDLSLRPPGPEMNTLLLNQLVLHNDCELNLLFQVS